MLLLLGGKQVFSATKLPSIFWKPVRLVFNYMALGSMGPVGRILDAMESKAAVKNCEHWKIPEEPSHSKHTRVK